MKILLATNNLHKIEEMRRILYKNCELVSPRDLGINIEVDETGESLAENAELKARAFYKASGIMSIADDTGLEVEALGGAPGVHSARYAGEGCIDSENRKKLLSELENSENRSARFRTVICCFDGSKPLFVSGECAGEIISTERGTGGFGYDPIFVPDGFSKTFAELSGEEKDAISHRGNAVRRFSDLLEAMEKPKMRIGFLASGGGTNVQAILEAVDSGWLYADAALVVSNNSDAGVFEKAKAFGVPTAHISMKNFTTEDERDTAIAQMMSEYGVNMVVLAGYMKKAGQPLINRFGSHILNIHPALLPKFGGRGLFGMNVHRAVIAAGEHESGPTVHVANNLYDSGRILAQRRVPVLPNDTPEDLQKRVLIEEHKIYADTLQKISLGEIKL